MNFIKVFLTLGGVGVLAGCVSNETVGRSETGDFHYSMSAMIEERDPQNSLAAVSMKDQGALIYSDTARRIIAAYGQ